jgi:hypothetical protein
MGESVAMRGRTKWAVVLFLLALIISAQAFDDRPVTGSVIKDTAMSGLGIVTVHNQGKMDAVAALTSLTLAPLIAVYVRQGESCNISGIDDGSYGLYFTMGEEWDNRTGSFDSTRGLYHFSNPLVFETKDFAFEVEYSVFDVNLYEVPEGKSNIIPATFDFPDLKQRTSKGPYMI